MATAASKLLRAARSASLAYRIAAAAASRAAAMSPRSSHAAASRAALMASRSSRAAAAAAARAARLGFGVIAALMSCPTCGHACTKPRDDASSRSLDYNDYEHVPDDAKCPSDKDVESDEAVWAFYEHWCKAFNKERDHAEMARRFKIFRYHAKYVHRFNTYLPPDPEEAAIYIQKRKEIAILLSKGEDVSDFDERYIPMELGQFADGGDPFIMESCKRLLLRLEKRDPFSAVEGDTSGKFA